MAEVNIEDESIAIRFDEGFAKSREHRLGRFSGEAGESEAGQADHHLSD